MAERTPGLWHSEYLEDPKSLIPLNGCRKFRTINEDEANARLCAAPELLAALEICEANQALRFAKAAIAKARGDTA